MNSSNIKCEKCGFDNNSDSNFCIKCGEKLEKDSITNNNEMQKMNNNTINNNDKSGNILGIISLIAFFFGNSLCSFLYYVVPENFGYLLSSLGGLFPMAGIVTMIIGRIKYPNNKLLKIVMWIIIVTIIVSVIFIVLFTIWCFVTCNNYDFSGCD